jgi:hypothetical protein
MSVKRTQGEFTKRKREEEEMGDACKTDSGRIYKEEKRRRGIG